MSILAYLGRYSQHTSFLRKEEASAVLAFMGLTVSDAFHMLLTRIAKEHALSNNWQDHCDCHIKPNLVLMYRKPDAETL